jgi:hypothetical protein
LDFPAGLGVADPAGFASAPDEGFAGPAFTAGAAFFVFPGAAAFGAGFGGGGAGLAAGAGGLAGADLPLDDDDVFTDVAFLAAGAFPAALAAAGLLLFFLLVAGAGRGADLGLADGPDFFFEARASAFFAKRSLLAKVQVLCIQGLSTSRRPK